MMAVRILGEPPSLAVQPGGDVNAKRPSWKEAKGSFEAHRGMQKAAADSSQVQLSFVQ
jgi:hypothetical protein